MRIPPETIRSLVGLHTQRVGKAASVGEVGRTANVYRSQASDSVSLSEEAALLNTLKQGVKAMPDVDAARVSQVRREMADGTFRFDAQSVAEGMILELTGAF